MPGTLSRPGIALFYYAFSFQSAPSTPCFIRRRRPPADGRAPRVLKSDSLEDEAHFRSPTRSSSSWRLPSRQLKIFSKFDRFTEYYNDERPRQAFNGRFPSQLYRPSARPYTGLGELEYASHGRTITVTQYGRLCIGRRPTSRAYGEFKPL